MLLAAICLLCGCLNAQATDVPPDAAPEETQEAIEVEIVPNTLAPVTPQPTPTATPVPTPTPTPEPTEVPTPEPTPLDLGLLDVSHADLFSFDSVVDTEDTYRDATRSITLTKYSDSTRTGRTLTYFVADIWLQNVEDLIRVQAKETRLDGDKIGMTDLAQREHTILAMSGDHCDTGDKIYSVINGEVVYNSKKFKWDLCVLYRDGTMATYAPDEINIDFIEAREPWITWNFGPSLLDRNGQPKQKFNQPDSIGDRNPRAVIGYYEPGHYCLVVVDGRQNGYSQGLNLIELSQLIYELGCKVAYNLDGGISAQMTWHGEMVNHQEKKRSICDIVCIPYPQPEE